MRKISFVVLGAFYFLSAAIVNATEKFDLLPDLPEPLAAAQASSVSTADTVAAASQSIGHEPNFISVALSLVFVVLLIYATGIIYAKLNKFSGKTFKNQLNNAQMSRVSIVSSTPLGGNRTLHVIELDGNRMLIGASPNSVQLIKELGTSKSVDFKDGEYSKIEIPNIRIPKIEIPKIEFPGFGFTKTTTTSQVEDEKKEEVQESSEDLSKDEQNDEFEISDIYEEGPDGIIDRLFQVNDSADTTFNNTENSDMLTSEAVVEHQVDPDEYNLYKKYL